MIDVTGVIAMLAPEPARGGVEPAVEPACGEFIAGAATPATTVGCCAASPPTPAPAAVLPLAGGWRSKTPTLPGDAEHADSTHAHAALSRPIRAARTRRTC